MTEIQNCDHHDPAGLVTTERSRAHMVAQLQAADKLAEVFLGLLRDQTIALKVARPDGTILEQPVIQIDWRAFFSAWNVYLEWRAIRPSPADLELGAGQAEQG